MGGVARSGEPQGKAAATAAVGARGEGGGGTMSPRGGIERAEPFKKKSMVEKIRLRKKKKKDDTWVAPEAAANGVTKAIHPLFLIPHTK